MNINNNKQAGKSKISYLLNKFSKIEAASFSNVFSASAENVPSLSIYNDPNQLDAPPTIIVKYPSFSRYTSKQAFFDSEQSFSGILSTENQLVTTNETGNFIYDKNELKKLGYNDLWQSVQYNGYEYSSGQNADLPSGYFSEMVVLTGAGVNALLGVVKGSGRNFNLYTYSSRVRNVNNKIEIDARHKFSLYGEQFVLNPLNSGVVSMGISTPTPTPAPSVYPNVVSVFFSGVEDLFPHLGLPALTGTVQFSGTAPEWDTSLNPDFEGSVYKDYSSDNLWEIVVNRASSNDEIFYSMLSTPKTNQPITGINELEAGGTGIITW
jgi:hypothetical protein